MRYVLITLLFLSLGCHHTLPVVVPTPTEQARTLAACKLAAYDYVDAHPTFHGVVICLPNHLKPLPIFGTPKEA